MQDFRAIANTITTEPAVPLAIELTRNQVKTK